MYKAINVWSFAEGMSLEEMMTEAKRLGYEGFEPALEAQGELSLESTDAEVRAVRALADRIGLRLTSLASGLSWGCSPVSNDPAVRERALKQALRVLECASLLGVGAVLYVPGMVGTGFWGGADDFVSYRDCWDRAVENCRALGARARELGVVLAVENVWNNFLLSPIEMKYFLETVGSDFVQAYFDVGNAVKFGFPELWIDVLGERIARVHVKDFKRSIGTLDGFTDLLSGDVDYPAVIAALERAGYDGPLTGEINNSVACYRENAVARAAAALDVILGRQGPSEQKGV